jgi:hypothetical protein
MSQPVARPLCLRCIFAVGVAVLAMLCLPLLAIVGVAVHIVLVGGMLASVVVGALAPACKPTIAPPPTPAE